MCRNTVCVHLKCVSTLGSGCVDVCHITHTKGLGHSYEQRKWSHMLGWGCLDMCICLYVCVTCSIINEAILITCCSKKLGNSYEQCKSSHMLGWGFPDMCMCVCVYVRACYMYYTNNTIRDTRGDAVELPWHSVMCMRVRVHARVCVCVGACVGVQRKCICGMMIHVYQMCGTNDFLDVTRFIATN